MNVEALAYQLNLTVYHMLSFKECRVAVLLKGSCAER
jgi:hypothetical protein